MSAGMQTSIPYFQIDGAGIKISWAVILIIIVIIAVVMYSMPQSIMQKGESFITNRFASSLPDPPDFKIRAASLLGDEGN
jgi:hypothetical protein